MSSPQVKVASVPSASSRRPHGSMNQDNQFLDEKLAIRRHFLDRYPMPKGRPFRVIDCCAGDRQTIWTRLRQEYPVQYLGMDKKKVGGGILKVDAARWLSQTEWTADVVDIDTYGEPWPIWEVALENFVGEEFTVFLTYCNVPVNNAIGLMSGAVRRRLGLPEHWKIWHARALSALTTNAMLAYALDRGFRVVEAARIRFVVQPGTGVRWDWNFLYLYMGLRLRWTT